MSETEQQVALVAALAGECAPVLAQDLRDPEPLDVLRYRPRAAQGRPL